MVCLMMKIYYGISQYGTNFWYVSFLIFFALPIRCITYAFVDGQSTAAYIDEVLKYKLFFEKFVKAYYFSQGSSGNVTC